MSNTVLTAHDVAVAMAGKRLLEGVTFSLARGECVACLGPSGSGKTTFLRALAGLIDVDDGEIRLEGRTPAEHGWPRFRRQVLHVSQRPALLDESVRFNLRRPFEYAGAGEAFDESRSAELLESLGLGNGLREKNARELSVGQQQRVCLARALMVRPRVLLLDEPTSALDEDAVESVERLLTAEAESSGLAIVVVTHNRQQAARWSDRVMNLGEYLHTPEATDE